MFKPKHVLQSGILKCATKKEEAENLKQQSGQ